MFVILLFSCLFALARSQCYDLSDLDTTAAVDNILDGCYDFGVELVKTLANRDDNVLVSPVSVYGVLLLAFFGSSGQTRDELESVLNLGPYSKEEFVKAMLYDGAINTNHNDKNYVFEVANRVYIHCQFRPYPCLPFGDALRVVNFGDSAVVARKINDWVAKKTRNKIKNVVEPNQICSNGGLAFINAAYFKGKWVHQFNKKDTKLDWFYLNSNFLNGIKTEMMYQKRLFRYAFSDDLRAQILELPFLGDTVSMYIILPPFDLLAFDETIKNLNPESLSKAMRRMYPTTTRVYIPKFKVARSYDLQNALDSLGVTDLFDPFRANFSDFSSIEGLYAGTALHNSYIEVNEEGSEATATTLITFQSFDPRRPLPFIANRPFIYMIYDNNAESILFIGILKDPRK